MTDSPSRDELLDMRISSIINSAEDAMFQKFDDLHKRGHNDDDVINYLRKQGYTDYADSYIEWSGALDPDREDNTTTNPVVPDPGNAPSYDAIPPVISGGLEYRLLPSGTWAETQVSK